MITKTLDEIETLDTYGPNSGTIAEWFETSDPTHVFARDQVSNHMQKKRPEATLRWLKENFSDFHWSERQLTRYAESQGWYKPKGR